MYHFLIYVVLVATQRDYAVSNGAGGGGVAFMATVFLKMLIWH
jgi:hypothetical protein